MTIYGCKEFFEEDLSDSEVIMLAPFDSAKIVYAQQQFKWEPVYGAEWYNIRIVSPDFDQIELFLIDSNVVETSFNTELSPGSYQWAVQAANYSSQTPYVIYSLTIDTNKAFTNNHVDLLNPDNIYINSEDLTFSWFNVENADRYRFEIRNDEWSGGLLYYSKDIIENTVDVRLLEGNYYWGVKAYDSKTNAETAFSYKQILIDLTQPKRSELILPDANDTIRGNAVTLKWSREQDSGSPVFDSLIISRDSEFSDILINLEITDTVYSIQPDPGNYYWKVKALDKAGNKSDFSTYRKFTYESE
jgi:hypothetical protein